MGKISRDLRVFGKIGTKEINNVLLDGGSDFTVIRKDIARGLCDITPFFNEKGEIVKEQKVPLADGESNIKAIGLCTFQTAIEGRIVRDEAWVVEKLHRDMIIGAGTLQRGGIKLAYAEKAQGGDRIELDSLESFGIGT